MTPQSDQPWPAMKTDEARERGERAGLALRRVPGWAWLLVAVALLGAVAIAAQRNAAAERERLAAIEAARPKPAAPADRAEFARLAGERISAMRGLVDAAGRVGSAGNRVATADALARTRDMMAAVAASALPGPVAGDPDAQRVHEAMRQAALTLGIGMESAIRWNDDRKPSDAADMRRRVEAGREQLQAAEQLLRGWHQNPP